MAGEELDKYMADEPEQQSQETVSAPSSSVEVKPEVKTSSDVPYVDERGVPYFNRFKEMSEKFEKFKDVDPDRWSKLKDFDPEQVSRALELEKFMTSDKEKFQKALALYEQQQEQAQEDKEIKEGEKKYLTAEDFNRLIQEREQKRGQELEQTYIQNQWMNEWRKQVDSSMSTALKNEGYKDFGELHDRDKKTVMQEVGEVFEKDAQSRTPKLTLNDVPKVVESVIKSLYEYRQSIRGQAVKKDVSPQSITGNKGADAQKKAEGEYDEVEDTKDMINLYKELSNPHI